MEYLYDKLRWSKPTLPILPQNLVAMATSFEQLIMKDKLIILPIRLPVLKSWWRSVQYFWRLLVWNWSY